MNRRELLRRAAAFGVAVPAMGVVACGGDDGGDGLPVYSWEGPVGPETAFEHGVASGDPLADAVVLWTRLSPGNLGQGPHEVFVEVARDAAFTDRVAAEWTETDAARDFTVHLDAIDLEPGTTWYFRFSALGRTSPIGRTRTAPSGAVTALRFGVCSCSSLGHGYFHAYRHLAARPDLDAVIHLGDYIYEYASVGHGETYGEIRDYEPPHEAVTLDDYRLRYSQYRREADLQELHRQNPFVHVWDDHEFACDPFVGGAVNHQPDEGAWDERVDDALQAYSEWMPTRLGAGGRIFRRLAYGDLVDIVLVDRQRRFVWPDPTDGDHYLGKEQSDWLMDTIAASRAQWLLLGQGTRFASVAADGIGDASWDPHSRRAVLDAVAASGVENLVVLTGDIHRAGALDIAVDPQGAYDPVTGAGSEGIELYCNSISAPGVGDGVKDVPHYHWSDGLYRGYLVVDVTAERLHADFYGFIDTAKLEADLPDEVWRAGFTSAAGTHHLVETTAPAVPAQGASPLAP